MENAKHKHLTLILSYPLRFFFLLLIFHQGLVVRAQNATSASVHVGMVLDFNSTDGKRSNTSISMAIEDFYAQNANFKTRVFLEYRNSMSDIVSTASAALDLLKNSKVQAIIGPQTSTETEFVANMCNRSQVPLLSFSASSPSISPSQLPYFIRATINDSSQSIPIANFTQNFSWPSVVPIYEDSKFVLGIIPDLVHALKSVGKNILACVVVPTEATNDSIDIELNQLKALQTQVFIVHMSPALASRLFLRAQILGMMSEGYVWIVTDSVGDVIESLNPSVLQSMEGVIAFRSYVAHSEKINNFSTRFKTRFLEENPGMDKLYPTVYQFWAYDAIWAMATAIERANTMNLSFVVPQSGATDLSRIGVSQSGPKLRSEILKTTFDGLTGKFRLVDNQLQPSAFEIVNVVDKSARSIGFWTREKGIIGEINSSSKSDNGKNSLKSIVWPGNSSTEPKGWAIRNKLKILVPVKEGFKFFVNISVQATENMPLPITSVTGFCIDVFKASLNKLPYAVPYEFYPFNISDTYDNLVLQVFLKKYDAVVGDTTIRSNRTRFVDFTMPYTESGVSMVSPIKPEASRSRWVFLNPLTPTLWLTSFAFFFFTGFVVWMIEHRINDEFRGTPWQQFGLIFYFVFSTLVFAHKQKLESNLSRFMVIIWVFVVFILASSYTASLTSILTVQQITPTVTDVNQLIKHGDYVGYQDGSFVGGLLIKLGFDESKLKKYSHVEDYAHALSNGSVSAIFDEIPFLNVLLSKHCNKYTMITSITYKTDGFGFVLPKGSPLLPDLSRAVLNVTEGDEMKTIENNWLNGTATCLNQSTDPDSSSLSFHSFAGLFMITGTTSGLMLLTYLAMFVYKEKAELISMRTASRSSLETLKLWFRHYDGVDWKSPTFRDHIRSTISWKRRNEKGNDKDVNLTGSTGLQSPEPDSILNQTTEMNFVYGQEGTLTPPEIESVSNRGGFELEESLEFTEERCG